MDYAVDRVLSAGYLPPKGTLGRVKNSYSVTSNSLTKDLSPRPLETPDPSVVLRDTMSLTPLYLGNVLICGFNHGPGGFILQRFNKRFNR